jgi:hypothetical protein
MSFLLNRLFCSYLLFTIYETTDSAPGCLAGTARPAGDGERGYVRGWTPPPTRLDAIDSPAASMTL